MNRPKPPDTGNESDADLLARELADVKRLAASDRVPEPRPRLDRETRRARQAAATTAPEVSPLLDGSIAGVTPVAGDARLEFHRPGLQLRQWQKLRKGQVPWMLGVDLHGTTRADALRAVDRLIRQAQEEHVNCIRVVHGKGEARPGDGGEATTIKAELNHWLRRHEAVLAFCSATPADGGAGALYVLLRRQRN